MLVIRRLFNSYKYYKQIAEMVGVQVFKINQQITHDGSCFLLDKSRSSHRVTTVEQAKLEAQQKGQDLLLIKDGYTPSLQIRPYVYEIYRNFLVQLKRPKHPKTIPLTSKIQQNDIKNKIKIAKNIFKKGYGQLRLIGSDDTEDNLKILQTFVKQLEQNGEANFMLQKVSIGKKNKGKFYQKWVCNYSLKQLKPAVNYDLLDKRYIRMLKQNSSLEDIKLRNKIKPKNQSEQESDDQDIGFRTKQQGNAFLFNFDHDYPSRIKIMQPGDKSSKQSSVLQRPKESMQQEYQESQISSEMQKLMKMSAEEMDQYIKYLDSKRERSEYEQQLLKVLKLLLEQNARP